MRSLPSLLCLLALLLFPVFLAAQSQPEATASAAGQRYSEGAAAFQRGDLVVARKSFAAAVRLNPRDARARNALGLVLLSQNDAASAIAQFQAAIRLQPSFVIAHTNLSRALLQTRDLPGATREAVAAVRLAPNDPHAHLALAPPQQPSPNLP